MWSGKSIDAFTQIAAQVTTKADYRYSTIRIPVVSYIKRNAIKLKGVGYFSYMIVYMIIGQ